MTNNDKLYLGEFGGLTEASHVRVVALDQLTKTFLNRRVSDLELECVRSVLVVLAKGFDYFVAS